MNMSKVLQEHEGVYSTTPLGLQHGWFLPPGWRFRPRKTYTEDQVDHNMEVTGWGITASGTKYWVVRTEELPMGPENREIWTIRPLET